MLFCSGLLLSLTGCIGVLPRPVSRTKVEYGHRLKDRDVAFISPGVTTRDEVLARLGTNFVALPLGRATAYSWEMKGGGAVWWAVFAFSVGGIAETGSWEGGWRAFFIAFDDSGVVNATAWKKLSMRRCLHEQLSDWAKRQSGSPMVAFTRQTGHRSTGKD